MSVIEAKRKQSGVQFLNTAMKIAEHTFKYTTSKKFDKCDKDVVRRVRDLSLEILVEVEKANAIFPKCQIDVEQRYIHFISAIGSCEALCSLLSVVKYSITNKITAYGWQKWGEYLGEEISLIKGIITSDKNLQF